FQRGQAHRHDRRQGSALHQFTRLVFERRRDRRSVKACLVHHPRRGLDEELAAALLERWVLRIVGIIRLLAVSDQGEGGRATQQHAVLERKLRGGLGRRRQGDGCGGEIGEKRLHCRASSASNLNANLSRFHPPCAGSRRSCCA